MNINLKNITNALFYYGVFLTYKIIVKASKQEVFFINNSNVELKKKIHIQTKNELLKDYYYEKDLNSLLRKNLKNE